MTTRCTLLKIHSAKDDYYTVYLLAQKEENPLKFVAHFFPICPTLMILSEAFVYSTDNIYFTQCLLS